jgi:WYL_2, Sm-like SH3 beta-barrel fold
MATKTKITHADLKNKLKAGSFKFYFRKVSGELREALGTLDLSRIPSAGQPKGGSVPGDQTAYYDLEVGAWRSISSSQEIWID